MNKIIKKALIIIGILILGIIVTLLFLAFRMFPEMEPPAPTPQSIHKQQTLYNTENCQVKVASTVFDWAEKRGLHAQNSLSEDRAAIFIVPDKTYFIEFFYEFRREDKETDLSLGLIPSRQMGLIDYSQLSNHWQGLEMSGLWENIVFSSNCQKNDLKETIAGGVGCVESIATEPEPSTETVKLPPQFLGPEFKRFGNHLFGYSKLVTIDCKPTVNLEFSNGQRRDTVLRAEVVCLAPSGSIINKENVEVKLGNSGGMSSAFEYTKDVYLSCYSPNSYKVNWGK